MKTLTSTTNVVLNTQEQKIKAAWSKRPTAIRLQSDTVALIKSYCPKSYTTDAFIFALVSRYGSIIQNEGLEQLKKIVAKNENQRGT